MNKEMDKLIKIDSMITEVELKAKVIARSGSNKKLQRNRNDQRTIIKTGRAVKAIC